MNKRGQPDKGENKFRVSFLEISTCTTTVTNVTIDSFLDPEAAYFKWQYLSLTTTHSGLPGRGTASGQYPRSVRRADRHHQYGTRSHRGLTDMAEKLAIWKMMCHQI